MTAPEIRFRAVPGPGFVVGCTVSTWVRRGPDGPPVAYLLLGYPPPRRARETAESIEVGLMGMVDAMGLRPAAERIADVGPRLILRGPYVALDYGHPRYFLRVPGTDYEWRGHVGNGGAALLALGLDPIPPGAGPDAVEAYVERVLATGRAYVGETAIRNP